MKGKNVIVGITGSIAAYKAAILIRLLVKEGASVRVLMTPMAKQFIAPLSLATLAKYPVLVDFHNPENGDWNSHVDMGLWADAYLIAPATANTIAKMAHGVADNLLLTTYLSARCPVFVAPAMDLDMYKHPATQQNINTLRSCGVQIIEPAEGELASGLMGKGRMEEPEIIAAKLRAFFIQKLSFAQKSILITAGPTYEAIDPVRYISNYSSGKMGYALAATLAAQGAHVTLISGPVYLSLEHPNIEIVKVVSAEEMLHATLKYFINCHCAIMAAAVADYTPVEPHQAKMKRTNDHLIIRLEPTVDIAAEVGKIKSENQVLVGFALETDKNFENALHKLQKKNLDFIVLNTLSDEGAGFGFDTNKISIIFKDGNIERFDLKTKNEVARDIVDRLAGLIEKQTGDSKSNND